MCTLSTPCLSHGHVANHNEESNMDYIGIFLFCAHRRDLAANVLVSSAGFNDHGAMQHCTSADSNNESPRTLALQLAAIARAAFVHGRGQDRPDRGQSE